ncbi:MAG: hypothetical protein WCV92_01160 [Candidatus Buchananbacteria bacterium]
MKKINPQKTYSFFEKYLNTLVLAAVVIILGVLIYFLYTNFYLTLSEAKVVTSLQNKVISERLEKEKFYLILDNINKKTSKKIESISSSSPSLANTSTSSTIPKLRN